MARPYSTDLRERVVQAVEEGLSRRQAADRFGIGIKTGDFVHSEKLTYKKRRWSPASATGRT